VKEVAVVVWTKIENSAAANLCLSFGGAQKAAVIAACTGANTYWAIGKEDGEIRPQGSQNECLGLNPSGGGVRLEACDPKKNKWQRWDVLPDGRIRNENAFLCLEPQGAASAGAAVNVGGCRSPASVWRPKS
jgi:hypothetical protein